MNREQATEAVRNLLNEHGSEMARFDRVADALKPRALSKMDSFFGLQPGSRTYPRQRQIAEASQANYLPLILDVFSQSMKLDGLFTGENTPSPSWDYWLRNQMGARQTGIHRAALMYGSAYAVATAGQDGVPVIDLCSPRQMVALYGERFYWPGESGTAMEWPILAMQVKDNRIRMWDETTVYYFGVRNPPSNPVEWTKAMYNYSSNLEFIESRPHGVGNVPVVCYRDRMLLDGEEQFGIIEPLMSIQDRLDMTKFEMGQAQYVSAFKQRYIAGWMPKSEADSARMKASDTWFFDKSGKDMTIGQFSETDFAGYNDSYAQSLRDMSSIGQLSPANMGAAAISNMASEGLAALEHSKELKSSEIQTSLGESHEQLLRLCAHIAGDDEAAADFKSEVKWADMTARSLAQVVDALGKLATMLGVPASALVEDVPGWSRERVERVMNAMESQPAPSEVPTGEGLWTE